MNLEELIARFKQKDAKAFETLYDMYADNICGMINTIVRDSERAQEICQDVFVKVWQNSASYSSSKGRFFTWLLNIARNAAIDEIRSKSHKEQKKNLVVDYFVGIKDHSAEESARMDNIAIRRLLKGLKQQCLKLIDLLYFKGYTQKEAAEELGIPLGTVKTRNRNCIAQIRKNSKLA